MCQKFFCRHARFAASLQLVLLGLVVMVMCGSHPISAGLAAGARARIRALPGSDRLTIGFWISNRDLEGEKKLLSSLSRPGGSAYHQWLSSASFQARFAPTAADVSTVQSFLASAHLRILPESNANLLLASGTVAQIEQFLHISIGISGKYYSPFDTPKVPAAIAPLVAGVLGLTNRPIEHANAILAPGSKKLNAATTPYGGGVDGSGLTPSQIAGIYDAVPLSRQGNRGQGTTLGLFELSGYTNSDIPVYEDAYKLPHMHLVDIPVLGGSQDHTGADEVEADIELQVAMAPGAHRLLVYNAPNTQLGIVMAYDRIAQDNLADAISTSWGACEYLESNAVMQAENQIFLQMALQGQSMFAASGDSGAYDCASARPPVLPPAGQERQVDDPGDQPYITSVGGTSFQGVSDAPLFDPGENQNPGYPGQLSEKPWSQSCFVAVCVGASGGGISHTWSEPDYALNPATSKYYPGVVGWYSRSGTYCQQKSGVLCREVPDVSLNADAKTGYSIYCTDRAGCTSRRSGASGWIKVGGTSCSAPLWAGIVALAIHQQQNQRLGLLNYLLYPLNSSAGYAHQFHDIVSNLSNGQPFQVWLPTSGRFQIVAGYAATRDYDLATGIGTPDIAQLVESAILTPVVGRG